MSDIIKQLDAHFPVEAVSWRVGSTSKDKTQAIALAYIDARDVMDRLDEVMGRDNWQDRYEYHGGTAICYLSLRLNGEWITKADGAGTTAVEAEKGQVSDAFKRAAVKWGIGRYLYDLKNTWVKLENNRIPQGEYAKLEKSLRDMVVGQKPQPKPPETMGMTHQEIAADWTVEQRQAALDKALGELVGIGDVETFKAKKASFTKLYREYVRYNQTDMAEELTEAINTVKKDLGVE